MNSVEELNNYFNQHQIKIESDSITKELIKSYFEEEALKEKWGKILEKDFKVDYSTPVMADTVSTAEKPKSKALLYALLLAIIGALILAINFWKPSSTSSEDRLQALLNDQYSNPVPRELVKGPAEDFASIQNAYALYQSKDYEAAIPLLEQAVTIEPSNEDHLFYLGLSYLYNKDAENAILQFDIILNQEASNKSDAATWYKALALTEAQNYDDAKVLLKEVSEWTGNSGKLKLAEEARLLLDAIEDK